MSAILEREHLAQDLRTQLILIRYVKTTHSHSQPNTHIINVFFKKVLMILFTLDLVFI